jgi:hypothetical protein
VSRVIAAVEEIVRRNRPPLVAGLDRESFESQVVLEA